MSLSNPRDEGSAIMIDDLALEEAQRALGRELAARRGAAGLVQHELAPLIHYGRSTIANAEAGRQTGSRGFWQTCDLVLQAGGALLDGYDELQALRRQARLERARSARVERARSQLDSAQQNHRAATDTRHVKVSLRADRRTDSVSGV